MTTEERVVTALALLLFQNPSGSWPGGLLIFRAAWMALRRFAIVASILAMTIESGRTPL